MLGNQNTAHPLGQSWCNVDERVWVCPNLAKAKKVLAESQRFSLEPHCVWTTIYKVVAENIQFEQANNGLLYTNTPTKVIVERIVFQQMPQITSEQQLLRRAGTIMPSYKKLMNGAHKRRMR